MKEELNNLKNNALAQIIEAGGINTLEELRISYLGRNGSVNKFFKELGKLDSDDRKDFGILLNETKKTIEEAIGDKEQKLTQTLSKGDKYFDPSIPGEKYKIGHLHPTTIVINEMFDIFKHLGFSNIEGPEIESDKFNFEILNLPKDHPARSLQDALFIQEPEVVLRTHTSSVESRALTEYKPPFRFVVAGKCYRYENVNASNNAMFYQFQGFALQEGLSMADLKGTLIYFVKKFFGEDREIRARCKYYPEVEPGMGVDIDCRFCKKKGCSVCKGRGWIEMLGSGMIHPNILKNLGYKTEEMSGFAFGMGLDRIVMDRFGIPDIRSLYNGDIKY
ncbi:MAG: Phenylalanine-tRNA ligase alpha subunit [Candidatus Woesebacteria bacterium GW2011_GWB1_38_5]|uniref:Phenylalanine--tRNA ligase alpha subunit n=4 Tax=Candidatus Woeseibacteriota TaxID=1752722 RepID=A0A0G0N9K0_9BACT|nr:MAG: Phenylalanine-tRNA ligase alpha subunit [Candidatus Woesebacteria bacterium GW2011_GWD1_38_10]KKQ56966.1 MAG: Phenylalanine-tRNA ligase alpha subunit [Candidatus Woesebacteria bacterium GW2011_GWC1_38_13]KKQ75577.1 MAG: Phenylalanine-tRNA ligase alpha subunit [Candidatus Woesebacteria bacterium GW2011_GWB1_38_5]KKQ76236.1 MAG: Phenylalanine-tRNA ligase alpha subunit [Microgenomates group bacterium GW2011_GWF1_38_5]KKQ82574.1 MAG: Phenylalanine-tRNA ligase alpha subunit [Candidatus Woese